MFDGCTQRYGPRQSIQANDNAEEMELIGKRDEIKNCESMHVCVWPSQLQRTV